MLLSHGACVVGISCPSESEGCPPCSDINDSENGSPLSVKELTISRPYFVDALNEIKGHIGVDTVAVDLGCGSDMSDLRLLQSFGCSTCIGFDILEKPAAVPLPMDVVYIRSDIDGSGLPLVSESCDVVILNNTLEHLSDPLNTLAEGVRVLRKGGLLVIITPNQADLKNRMLLLAGVSVYFPLSRWLLEGDDRIRRGSRTVFVGHVREYTASELRDMVRLIGCELVGIKYLATARTQPLPIDGEVVGASGRADRMIRNSGVLFGVYSFFEKVIPSFRAQISVVARKQ